MTNPGIVAFAFAVPVDASSNKLIVALAERGSKARGSCPVFTQPELVFSPENLDVSYVRQGNAPAPTLRIARAAIAWAVARGIDELFIVCAQPHAWRCLRDLEIAAREAIYSVRIIVCDSINEIPYDAWFCRDSMQWHTSSKYRWCLYDSVLRSIPAHVYAGIAS